MECLIYYLTKSIPILKDLKIRNAIHKEFPHIPMKDVKALANFIQSLNKKLNLQSTKRHPVILIIEPVCFDLI